MTYNSYIVIQKGEFVKKAMGFRLSDTAARLLKQAATNKGVSQTAVVEMLIRDRLGVCSEAVSVNSAGRIKLGVFSLVGRAEWVTEDDGDKVYKKVVETLKAGYGVSLSLLGRDIMTHGFLNAAIGQLYNGDYSDAFLTASIEVIDATSSDLVAINRVIGNAKIYFFNLNSSALRLTEELYKGTSDES